MNFKDDGKFIAVVMDDGEDLINNLEKIACGYKNEKILCVISALGMLKEVKMGYWNGKEYDIYQIEEPVELLGISGIITPNTEPFYHFHIYVGTKEGKAYGGHLISAKICNTLEIFLIKGNIKVIRREEDGLKKLKIDEPD